MWVKTNLLAILNSLGLPQTFILGNIYEEDKLMRLFL
jgi:hypothetical protein